MNGKERVLISEKTEIVFAKPISLADISRAIFWAHFAETSDGTLVAHECAASPSQSIRHRPSTAATIRR